MELTTSGGFSTNNSTAESKSDLPDFDALLEETANEPPPFIPPVDLPPRQQQDQYQRI